MRLLSIRTLNVALVISCVVAVGVLCTTLTLVSTERALSDTRLSRDTSVNSAFESGGKSVVDVTEQYLQQLGVGAQNQLEGFWGVSRDLVNVMCSEMNAADPAVVVTWDYIYSKRAQMYNTFMTFESIDGMTIVTEKHQALSFIEGSATLKNKPGMYHHAWVAFNNGSDYDQEAGAPAAERTLTGSVIPDGTGNIYGMYTNRSNEKNLCDPNTTAIWTNGTQLDPPCFYHMGDIQKVTYGGVFNTKPRGEVYFSSLTSLHTYMAIVVRCDYGWDPATQRPFGAVFSGSDLRKVSQFLETMDLGQDRGSLGRVFLVVRGSTSTHHDDTGYLAGSSHGGQFKWVPDDLYGTDGERAVAIPAANSSDLYVSGAAQYLERDNGTGTIYENLYLTQMPQRIRLPAERNGTFQDEDFYVRVQVFDNGLGLNWYVVSLIDREYILGQVDRDNQETRERVAASEDAVAKELNRSRALLYVILIVCAVIPVILTVIFVFRITEPLMLLMQDMSHVAVMNLEAVDADRSPSMLSEVRGMEISFKQMLKNLVEYRQYLPQSLLVDSVTDEEDSINEVLSLEQTMSAIDQSKRSTASTGAGHTPPRTVLFDATLHTRCITLFVSNIGHLHSVRDARSVGDLISTYLEPFVQHARKQRGIVDDVSGDKVTVSFNATIPTSCHKVRAVELGHIMNEQWRESVGVNLAISSGNAVCGNMGCTGLKKYATVGAVASNVRAIERCGSKWGIQFICDGSVASEAHHTFVLRKFIKARMKDGKLADLHEVIRAKEVCNEEWMYQLDRCDKSHSFAALNSAVTSIYEGDFDGASRSYSEHGAPSDLTKALLDYAARTGSAPEPVDLFICPSLFPTP